VSSLSRDFFKSLDVEGYLKYSTNRKLSGLGLPPTREEYIRLYLAEEMRKHSGCKRIRKKKAQRSLVHSWKVLLVAMPLARLVNYAQIGRDMFKVEPMPAATGLSYYKE